jgi:dimethylamine/trimethylamine dehydrogenase
VNAGNNRYYLESRKTNRKTLMSRDPRYDILFEPVDIGPVTAKNRFYQVPHCNGMGYRDPTAVAVMRGIKAEGGWGVVCTEQVEFHHSAEITPFIELRLWDKRDIPMLARMMDQIHEHDALGGIELCYPGMGAANLYSRSTPMGPSALPVNDGHNTPSQARAMSKRDIADLRRWHRDAALRARSAGADIVYVYAGKYFSGLTHFLSKRYNQRIDEYGGSLENRMRILREILADTKDAVGETCGVVCRISIDDLMGEAGLQREETIQIVEALDDYPDAWDLTLSGWPNDSQTSRFSEEGYQEPYTAGFKQVSKKPIIGTGRFTSPDTMVSQIRRGVLDMIGAARPSIADPFLPKKIEEGRLDEIRECIGCNICVSGDFLQHPMRCTQNPTMSEEWRRGWHPERIRAKTSDTKVLVIGAGPCGLEAARAAGKRGYQVVLAEATRSLGGRVDLECRLPGLSAWGRVRDYRQLQLQGMSNVDVYYDSQLTATEVLDYGFEHIAVATGSTWRRDGVARFHTAPIEVSPNAEVLTPDDLMAGRRPTARHVVLYDDDHYYMGGVLGELLASENYQVTLVTPAADVSNWTHATMEQDRIQARLIECGVRIVTQRSVNAVAEDHVDTACVFTGRCTAIECDGVVLVTARTAKDDVYVDLMAQQSRWCDAGIQTVSGIGDAWAPSTIASAVYEGHKYAQQLDDPEDRGDVVPFNREVAELSSLKR